MISKSSPERDEARDRQTVCVPRKAHAGSTRDDERRSRSGRASSARPLDWLLQAALATRDFLLPLVCATCTRPMDPGEPGIVCGRCWARLAPLASPRCQRCGHPGDGAHRCRWCDLLPPFVRAVRSVARVDAGTASAVVHALKYGGWQAVASGMAERMARLDWPQDVIEERSALVPVPLGRARLRARGYNQSGLLAYELARRWAVPVWDDVLCRSRETRSQTRLTPEERKRNVFGAFVAPESHRSRLRGAHVVIVDDVVTTGATLHACAEALFAGGARVVSYVTFGRAPALGDQR